MPSDTPLNDETSERVIELEALIHQARHDYYNGEPTVTNEVYDAWADELSELKHDSPALTAIGAPPVSAWAKYQHTITMGSLNKVNSLEELTSWVMGLGPAKTGALMVTEKLDGISIAIDYVKGRFSRAVTRGDGVTGEDISVNVARMQGVAGTLPEEFTGTLRGEIILTKSNHAQYFAQYANARNAASGIAKRYDGQGCQHLTVKLYQVADGKDFDSEGDQFTWLEAMGLQTPNWYVTAMMIGTRTPHDLWLEYQQFKRDELDYEIDGLVVRVNALADQYALGEVDGRPKGAIAFKFNPMTRETTVRRIDWQVGGTGRITPVAIVDPVSVLGTEITNASLYNVAYINQLALDVGAVVVIARANDVIPRVVAVRTLTGTIAQPPQACPTCATVTEMQGEYVVCPNSQGCADQTLGRLKRYLTVVDVKEWGDVLLEKLIAAGHVMGVPDLYRLEATTLASIERMGNKSATKCIKLLQEKKRLPLETLLGALSIPLCGPSTIKLAIDAGFDSLAKLQSATVLQLSTVDGLGPVRANSIVQWLRLNTPMVEQLLQLGVEIVGKVHGPLTGLSVCFTGTSSRPRADLEAIVRKAGGEVKNSVAKKLTYLVLADPNSSSSKAQAARKNGTTCITEEQLLKIIGAQ